MSIAKELGFDPYAALGLSLGASKDSIGKVARKLALKYHPDKSTDADAPALFLQVQKAKEFLLDETKRKEYDDVRVAVVKRKQYEEDKSIAMDEKRKRFRDDLENKLSAAVDLQKITKTTVTKTISSSHQEMDLLRQENLLRMKQTAQEQQKNKEQEIIKQRQNMTDGPLSFFPNAFMKDAQCILEKQELEKKLDIFCKANVVISVKALVSKESDVMKRMMEASKKKKEAAAASSIEVDISNIANDVIKK